MDMGFYVELPNGSFLPPTEINSCPLISTPSHHELQLVIFDWIDGLWKYKSEQKKNERPRSSDDDSDLLIILLDY